MFLFFKQKTAYEMRISDWSSDVCSSDLAWTTTACCRACAEWSKATPTTTLSLKSTTMRWKGPQLTMMPTHHRIKVSLPQTTPIPKVARIKRNATMEFFGGPIGLAVGSAATGSGRNDRLERLRHDGDGHEPSSEAVYADTKRNRGRPARIAEYSRRLRGFVHAGWGDGRERHRAAESDRP